MSVMVRTESMEAAPGMTDGGAKAHFKLLRRSEQLKVTEPLKAPDCGATMTVKCPEPCVGMLNAGGLAAIVHPALLPTSPHCKLTSTAEDI